MTRLPGWVCGILLAICLGKSAPLVAVDHDLWSHYPNQNVVSSIAEGEDEIFFGTTGGIRRYHRFRDTWLRPITTADGLPDNQVDAMRFDPSTGDLEIRTRTGTARWMTRIHALNLGGFTRLDPVRHVSRIPSVAPPFGYYINGNIVRGPHQNYGITDTLVDSWNILWIATEGLGIGRADLKFNELTFIRSGPIVQNVTAIEIDESTVWVGGRDDYDVFARGISRFDRETDEWVHFEQEAIQRLDDTQVNDIVADSSDVWFATDRGVVRYQKQIEAWDTYRLNAGSGTRRLRRATSLARAGSRLWIGTERGLAVLDHQTDTIRAVGGSEIFRIRDLASGAQYVWAATNKGLFRTSVDDVTWKEASTNPATRQPILALDVSGDTTWAFAALPPTLLVSTNPDSSWRTLSVPEAGSESTVSLSASGERAWIGTNSGIIRISTETGKLTTMTRIDGLLHDKVTGIRLEGPYVWVGSRKGLSRYRWLDDFNDPDD